jgi:hypothetical protein
MVYNKFLMIPVIIMCLTAATATQLAAAATTQTESVRITGSNPSDAFLCQKQTRGFETVLSIPTHLLTAISLAESGKWDQESKALSAWPWTVMAEGKGHYMPSKQHAIAKVAQLLTKGVKNIDVGCMQINLFYHPKAFEDLNAAFDPERNVGYAANFLAAINQLTQSWPQAAANYHSTTTSKNQKYLNKVLALWQKISKRSILTENFYKSPDPAYLNPEGRRAQTALLRSRFRARLHAEQKTDKPKQKMQDLSAWRNGRFDKGFFKAATALKKAKRVRSDKEYLKKGKKSFSYRRISQLAEWRKRKDPAVFRK